MEEKLFRNRVAWMMFLLSILVIWVHSYNVELFAGKAPGVSFDQAAGLETFLSVTVGQIAVPGFFLLSSYQFFRGFAWDQLAGKWKRRFFSIAVPYAVWNLLYYLGYVTATRLPAVRAVVGKEPVPFSAGEMVRAVLDYAYAPVFWYLYQLILLIFLSPAIYLLMKRRILGLAVLAAMLAAIHFHLDTGRPNMDALFYYSFAAYMALHFRAAAESGPGALGRSRGAGFGLGAAGLLLAAYCLFRALTPGADVLWTVCGRLLAPVSLWILLGAVSLPESRPWMRQSLFLYAVHFVIVRFVNKGAALAVGRLIPAGLAGIAAVLVFLLLPAFTAAVSYGMALALSRWAPPVWRMLSGGRSLGRKN